MADLALAAQHIVRGDGEGRVMLELARALLDRGHRLTIYSTAIDAELEGEVTYRHLRAVPGPQPLEDLYLLGAGGQRLRQAEHDLVCIKGACVIPTRPFVYYASFCHAGWRATWTHRTRPGRYHRAHNRMHIALERRIWPRAEHVLAVSRSVGEDLGVPADRLTVVPNGVDLSAFSVVEPVERSAARAALGLPDDALVVAFVGEHATGRKGLEPLIAAVARGHEHLLVAGRGPEGRVQALASAAGATGRVHVLGYTPSRQVLAAADLAAVPSRYEPFSLVAAEAAASGLPLLLSSRVGAADHLAGGAVVVEDPDDLPALRAGLDELGDAPRRALLGANAREAAERLDWATTAGRAAEVIAEIASAVSMKGRS